MIGFARHFIRRIHEEESGQVTVLFVFASVAFVIILGFILSTAQQTSRKIQMQNAADATAVAGATWVARGMNLVAFDNKGMADVLGVMIDVHSVYEAAQVMPIAIDWAAAAIIAATLGFGSELAALMVEEEPFWIALAETTYDIDQELSGPGGLGWSIMGTVDTLSVDIAKATPLLAEADSVYYAAANGLHKNGLPTTVGAVLAGGLDSLPVERGGKERLAIQANSCCLSHIETPTWEATLALCFVAATPCLTGPLFIPLYYGAVALNVNSLQGQASANQFVYTAQNIGSLGGNIQNSINNYNQSQQTAQQIAQQNNPKAPSFTPINMSNVTSRIGGITLGIGPLRWPGNNPPEPMILTDTGNPDQTDDSPPPASSLNLLVVRDRLQYLAGAWSPNTRNGVLAGAKLINPAPYGWLTYAQADVYNPSLWDMFDQHWRTRLARASNLNLYWNQLTSKLGVTLSGAFDSSFVNTH